MTTGNLMAAEIATQPRDWVNVQDRLPSYAADLPSHGERVAVIGCGTSWFMAQAYAALREDAGHGPTDAWPASEHRVSRDYDRILCITRSGTTTEVIDVLKELRDGVPATVITAVPHAPVTNLATAITLADVDEESVVQTRFATTTLALLRASLGHDLRPVADQAGAVLAADEASFAEFRSAEQFTFLGRGWTVGLAHEAALKLRESAQLWTESYPAMEYRHGPISITTQGRVTWAFGEVPNGLADDVGVLGGSFVHADIDPMADLVRVHRLCLIRAAAAGLDPDRPRGLNRSIILDD
jgi:fructoselysine-6-P-deglycase FrlB-like protein